MVGTLEVLESVKKNESINIIPIYIKISDEERLCRMLERALSIGDTNYRELARRFFKDNEDFTNEKIFKLGITPDNIFENNNAHNCALKIYDFIKMNIGG
jgi:hypothetical protein